MYQLYRSNDLYSHLIDLFSKFFSEQFSYYKWLTSSYPKPNNLNHNFLNRLYADPLFCANQLQNIGLFLFKNLDRHYFNSEISYETFIELESILIQRSIDTVGLIPGADFYADSIRFLQSKNLVVDNFKI